MATAAVTPVSVDEYIRSVYEPDAEYFDGKVQERTLGDDDHSAWQHAIEVWFERYVADFNIRIRPDLRIKVSEEVFLIPDVAILDGSRPKEKIVSFAPRAVFEIWSPGSSVRTLMRKLSLYDEMGIPNIWHLDPADGIWQRYADQQLVDTDVYTDEALKMQFQMTEISKLVR